MQLNRSDIIAKLQKEILPLQGFKQVLNNAVVDIGLGTIRHAFPSSSFPLGAIHEFICNSAEDKTASSGFVAGICSRLMRTGAAVVWINSTKTIYPPALQAFGIDPSKIIFIDSTREKELLWAIEEALKCEGLAAVIGELTELTFTTSRRLQLAVENSRVTGFILRNNPRQLNTTATIARWKISPIPSQSNTDMPGVGFPNWNVELLKVRNGKPGQWQVYWKAGRFYHYSPITIATGVQHKKTG